jgi:hypothetical protein
MGIGYFFVFTCLFAKTYRIHKIFNDARRRAKRYLMTTPKLAAFVLLPSFLIVSAFLSAWTALSEDTPYLWFNFALSTQYLENVYDPRCSTSNWTLTTSFVLCGVTAVGCSLVSYKVKNLPTKYNESSSIFFSVFFMLTYSVLIVPLNFLTADMQVLGLIRGIGTEFGVSCVGFALMGIKVLVNMGFNLDSTSSGNSGHSGHSGQESAVKGSEVEMSEIQRKTSAAGKYTGGKYFTVSRKPTPRKSSSTTSPAKPKDAENGAKGVANPESHTSPNVSVSNQPTLVSATADTKTNVSMSEVEDMVVVQAEAYSDIASPIEEKPNLRIGKNDDLFVMAVASFEATVCLNTTCVLLSC